MEKKDDVSQKRRESIQKRWNKKNEEDDSNTKNSQSNTKVKENKETKDTNKSAENTNEIQNGYKSNTNVIQNDTKKRKEKERKEKENKEKDFINTFRAEPKVSVPEEEIIIELTLNDKSKYPVLQSDFDKYSELYPVVDVMGELRKMEGWFDGNPNKRKTKTGIKRFINSWLSRAQDKGGNLAGMPRSAALSSAPGQFKTAKEKSYEAMMRFAGGGSFE